MATDPFKSYVQRQLNPKPVSKPEPVPVQTQSIYVAPKKSTDTKRSGGGGGSSGGSSSSSQQVEYITPTGKVLAQPGLSTAQASQAASGSNTQLQKVTSYVAEGGKRTPMNFDVGSSMMAHTYRGSQLGYASSYGGDKLQTVMLPNDGDSYPIPSSSVMWTQGIGPAAGGTIGPATPNKSLVGTMFSGEKIGTIPFTNVDINRPTWQGTKRVLTIGQSEFTFPFLSGGLGVVRPEAQGQLLSEWSPLPKWNPGSQEKILSGVETKRQQYFDTKVADLSKTYNREGLISTPENTFFKKTTEFGTMFPIYREKAISSTASSEKLPKVFKFELAVKEKYKSGDITAGLAVGYDLNVEGKKQIISYNQDIEKLSKDFSGYALPGSKEFNLMYESERKKQNISPLQLDLESAYSGFRAGVSYAIPGIGPLKFGAETTLTKGENIAGIPSSFKSQWDINPTSAIAGVGGMFIGGLALEKGIGKVAPTIKYGTANFLGTAKEKMTTINILPKNIERSITGGQFALEEMPKGFFGKSEYATAFEVRTGKQGTSEVWKSNLKPYEMPKNVPESQWVDLPNFVSKSGRGKGDYIVNLESPKGQVFKGEFATESVVNPKGKGVYSSRGFIKIDKNFVSAGKGAGKLAFEDFLTTGDKTVTRFYSVGKSTNTFMPFKNMNDFFQVEKFGYETPKQMMDSFKAKNPRSAIPFFKEGKDIFYYKYKNVRLSPENYGLKLFSERKLAIQSTTYQRFARIYGRRGTLGHYELEIDTTATDMPSWTQLNEYGFTSKSGNAVPLIRFDKRYSTYDLSYYLNRKAASKYSPLHHALHMKGQFQSTLAHEILHYKTQPTIDRIPGINWLDRKLPYRFQPSEMISFGLEKHYAEKGFPAKVLTKTRITPEYVSKGRGLPISSKDMRNMFRSLKGPTTQRTGLISMNKVEKYYFGKTISVGEKNVPYEKSLYGELKKANMEMFASKKASLHPELMFEEKNLLPKTGKYTGKRSEPFADIKTFEDINKKAIERTKRGELRQGFSQDFFKSLSEGKPNRYRMIYGNTDMFGREMRSRNMRIASTSFNIFEPQTKGKYNLFQGIKGGVIPKIKQNVNVIPIQSQGTKSNTNTIQSLVNPMPIEPINFNFSPLPTGILPPLFFGGGPGRKGSETDMFGLKTKYKGRYYSSLTANYFKIKAKGPIKSSFSGFEIRGIR